MDFDFDIKKDVEYSLESKKIDLDFFCKLNDISRKTIYNQSLNPSNYKSLNKIYDGIYALGVRLNKIKAEIFEETNSSDSITIYHGSKNGLGSIKEDGSRLDCDFGPGFYLTRSYESALSFIENNLESSIYAFRLDTSNLNVIELETNLEWMLLICYFRKGIDLPKEYDKLLEKVKTSDLVIAPIADNKMFEILNEFQNGLISTTQALHALSASRLGKQYVIKSKKALQNLKLINHMFVSNKEKESSKKNSFERANEIETKIFFAKREFRNQGKYIDELLK